MTPPQVIAHYNLTTKLGEGGMGAVYRATDTKLNRDVAVKILPDTFAADPDRLARFAREAQVLASLNHPNIAAIYGVEERALILELVDGATLAERIAQGPIPLEEALLISRQIIDALQYAHDRAIVHRDLKPANIKITSDGHVKVLDFGLAKALASDPVASDPAVSPTLTMRATVAGMIMGTAAYMAPEQAKGKPVDRRADIWAFGCVLYEMLTGKMVFEGETVSDILAAVLTKDPDLARVPPKVRPLLQSCFAKDPKERLQAIGDSRFLLNDAAAASTAPSRLPWIVAAALALAAAVALWAPWRSARPETSAQPLIRLDVDLGSSVSLESPYGANFALSPDGTRLVYCSGSRLFMRRLDQPEASEMPGTEGAYAPFFSPDGEWVAFFAAGKLKKISVLGGANVDLANSTTGWGGTWAADGTIVAALVTGPLSRLTSAGGTPTRLTEVGAGEITHRWPQFLPNGKAVLFTNYNATVSAEGTIDVVTLADRRRKTILRGGTYGRYVPSGHLIYLNQGTLFAVPFDLDRLQIRGTPVPVQQQVAFSAGFGSAQFDSSVSPSTPGTFVYHHGVGSGIMSLQWVDSSGHSQPLLTKPGNYLAPELSPDGSRVALTNSGEVWVYEPRRDTMTPLTFGGGHTYPIWSPDGRYVLFQSATGIFYTRADGGGSPRQLTQSTHLQYPWSVSPDGKRLAYQDVDPETGFDIWTAPLEDDGAGLRIGKPEPFLKTLFDERHGSFSPDGRWLAYGSNESGIFHVYVRAFPDKGGRWQISNTASLYPRWSRGGHDLFFRTLEGQIMVASYRVNGDSFEADKPRLWAERKLANVGLLKSYDLAPDGKRIAALLLADSADSQTSRNHLTFLLNFFDELRRKAPGEGK